MNTTRVEDSIDEIPSSSSINSDSRYSEQSRSRLTLLKKSLKILYGFILSIVFSIFTIYIVIEVNTQSLNVSSDKFAVNVPPPAKRAIIYLSDGQRADTTFSKGEDYNYLCPYLRRIAEYSGSYGISEATAPTETSICITSLLSGNYLDLPDLVSIHVDKSVNTDILLNEANFSLSVGNSEILGLFDDMKENNPNMIFVLKYPSYEFDKSCPENQKVLDLAKSFLKNSEINPDITQKLRGDGVIILLHVTCADEYAHKVQATKEFYTNSIKLTDSLVKEATEFFDSYFNDSKTAYFFTADHGMLDYGVHGGDDTLEVNTPFIAWGAGISKPVIDYSTRNEVLNWDLPGHRRKDLKQVDIAVLIASVIGIPIPINSEGVLPFEYIEDEKYIAQAILTNAKQFCSSYAKVNKKNRSILDAMLIEVQDLILKSKDVEAQKKGKEAVNFCMNGLANELVQQKTNVVVIFAFSFIGQVIYLGLNLHRHEELGYISPQRNKNRKSFLKEISIFILGSFAIYLWTQDSPLRFFKYLLLPVLYIAGSQMEDFAEYTPDSKKTYFWIALYFVLQILIPKVYEGEKNLLLGLFALWSIFNIIDARIHFKKFGFFALASIGLGIILTFNQIIQIETTKLTISWIFLCILNIFGALYYRRSRKVCIFLVLLSALSISSGLLANSFDSILPIDRQYQAHFHYLMGKLYIGLAILGPFLLKVLFKPDLNLMIFFGFASYSPLLIYQSLSYEPLFFSAFSIVMLLWRDLLKLKAVDENNKGTKERNFILILSGFAILSKVIFFGEGNVASLDTFRIESSMRFLEDFDVFRFALLIFMKFYVPIFFLNLYFLAIIKQEYPRISAILSNMLLIVMSNIFIFVYLNTEEKSLLDVKFALTNPLLVSSMILMNNLGAGLSYLLVRNLKISE